LFKSGAAVLAAMVEIAVMTVTSDTKRRLKRRILVVSMREVMPSSAKHHGCASHFRPLSICEVGFRLWQMTALVPASDQ